MSVISGGRTPYYSKVMGFIDGSNFLIELSKEIDINFRADKPPLPVLKIAKALTDFLFLSTGNILIRKYWFASYQGSDEDYILYAKALLSG